MLWLLLGTTALAVALAFALTRKLRARAPDSPLEPVRSMIRRVGSVELVLQQHSRISQAEEDGASEVDACITTPRRRSVTPYDVLLSVSETESLHTAKRAQLARLIHPDAAPVNS